MSKMKAVVLHGPDGYPNNYEVTEIEKPVCGPDEINASLPVPRPRACARILWWVTRSAASWKRSGRM